MKCPKCGENLRVLADYICVCGRCGFLGDHTYISTQRCIREAWKLNASSEMRMHRRRWRADPATLIRKTQQKLQSYLDALDNLQDDPAGAEPYREQDYQIELGERLECIQLLLTRQQREADADHLGHHQLKLHGAAFDDPPDHAVEWCSIKELLFGLDGLQLCLRPEVGPPTSDAAGNSLADMTKRDNGAAARTANEPTLSKAGAEAGGASPKAWKRLPNTVHTKEFEQDARFQKNGKNPAPSTVQRWVERSAREGKPVEIIQDPATHENYYPEEWFLEQWEQWKPRTKPSA